MYSRTQNENGTFNTRCLHCLRTVSSAIESDAELKTQEAAHTCPEKALSGLMTRTQSRPAGGARTV